MRASGGRRHHQPPEADAGGWEVALAAQELLEMLSVPALAVDPASSCTLLKAACPSQLL